MVEQEYLPATHSINSQGFATELEADGSTTFHWIDTSIDNLCSAKLWDILRLSELPGCAIDTVFEQQIINELEARNHYDRNKPWMKPH